MQWGPESSRRARAVEIWAALRSLGRAGIEQLIERIGVHAAKSEGGFRAAGFEVLNQVELNQILVPFGDDEIILRVIHGVQAEGTFWCEGTGWCGGHSVEGAEGMQISASSSAWTQLDVERSLAAILNITNSFQLQRSGHLYQLVIPPPSGRRGSRDAANPPRHVSLVSETCLDCDPAQAFGPARYAKPRRASSQFGTYDRRRDVIRRSEPPRYCLPRQTVYFRPHTNLC